MRLSLDGTWKYCLEMWKWIAEKKRGSHKSIWALKAQWMKENGFSHVSADCFFCECVGWEGGSCKTCPAALIDPNFSCYNSEYYFEKHPIKFYKELVRLDKLRRKNG